MNTDTIFVATQSASAGGPCFIVPPEYKAVEMPTDAKVPVVSHAHPCDGVDGWVLMEKAVWNSLTFVCDYLRGIEDVEVRKDLIDLFTLVMYVGGRADANETRHSASITFHVFFLSRAILNAEPGENRFRRYMVFKSFLIQALKPRPDPSFVEHTE